MNIEIRSRSLLKSVIWRLLGILILALVTYFYTKCLITTSLITFLHHLTFIFIFYAHERCWLKVKRIQNFTLRSVGKMFTYETLLGNVVLGLISFLITGDIVLMTKITATYIGIKHIVYILNEFVWKRIKWGKEGKVIVYTFIVGDLFHANHVRFLNLAKEFGDFLIVGVLSDEAVQSYKRKPFFSFEDRLFLTENVKCVDKVVPQYFKSPYSNLSFYLPDIVVHADDWKEDFPDADKIRELGIKIEFTPYLEGITTTKIIENVRKRS